MRFWRRLVVACFVLAAVVLVCAVREGLGLRQFSRVWPVILIGRLMAPIATGLGRLIFPRLYSAGVLFIRVRRVVWLVLLVFEAAR